MAEAAALLLCRALALAGLSAPLPPRSGGAEPRAAVPALTAEGLRRAKFDEPGWAVRAPLWRALAAALGAAAAAGAPVAAAPDVASTAAVLGYPRASELTPRAGSRELLLALGWAVGRDHGAVRARSTGTGEGKKG